MSAYDVIVIGAGPGGYVAAIRAGQLGLRTAIVERSHLGGICLNWGCIPTKSLLHSAELFEQARHASTFGVETRSPSINIAAAVARSRTVAGQLNAGVQFLLRKNKVDVIWGAAEILEPGLIRAGATPGDAPKGTLPPGEYQASHIVIATGASERRLPGIIPDGNHIWSYRHAMTASAVPASIAIIGGGAIGVEFASLYNTLGSRVTLIERLPRLLPQEDGEIADHMGKALRKRGVEVITGAEISDVSIVPGGVAIRLNDGGECLALTAEKLLSAAGVVANVDGLGLEKLGVALRNGAIAAGEFGRTNVPGIYAIGDVAGPPMLAHKAEHEGIRCVEAIAGQAPRAVMAPVPSCIFASPQVASIGLTQEAAEKEGQAIDIGRFIFRGNGKAVTLGETDGMVKVLFEKESGRLLGAHMIGPSVSELVPVFSLALSLGATRQHLVHMIFPHPTLSEALYEATLAADACAIHA
ncbi:MAG: dihydrolipoyl dehydrogenase [Shinella sp.]|uniref:dihydrolipoyl dehydrogenase n=1 Tax=Shinella sp. TaxID=1870904 RepID=UPI004036F3F0